MKKSAKASEAQPRSLQQISDEEGPGQSELWDLRLYVAGQTPRSIAAFANLKKICEQHLQGRYNIEVVDLVKHPQLAAGDQDLAIPPLVARLDQPPRKTVGDVHGTVRGLGGVQLRHATSG